MGGPGPVLLDASVPALPAVTARLKPFQAVLAPYREQVGWLEHRLPRREEEESELGNTVADSMLACWPEAQIALINDGGLRADLEVREQQPGQDRVIHTKVSDHSTDWFDVN